jgi:hypothetical protein
MAGISPAMTSFTTEAVSSQTQRKFHVR